MSKVIIAILSCATILLNANGQTKKIAFKSHSGNMANFETTFSNNLFDMENSNFGVAPVREIIDAQLDSVIFICDTAAIMVTSQYCRKRDRVTRVEQKQTLWSAGKDYVYHHPLFSRKHSLDSIKQVLQLQYYFKNPISKVVFIGYDNGEDTCGYNPISKTGIPPTFKSGNNYSFLGKELVVLISGVFLFAAFVTLLIKTSIYKPKNIITQYA
ncbi:MAG: hypothetical protein KA319_13575 [Ferruginibacter sp.]|nr:hypothetical protein [Ferruginibacter sp.]